MNVRVIEEWIDEERMGRGLGPWDCHCLLISMVFIYLSIYRSYQKALLAGQNFCSQMEMYVIRTGPCLNNGVPVLPVT